MMGELNKLPYYKIKGEKMLNNTRLKTIYSKIQTKLFYMIPEKWEKIFLYASIVDNSSYSQKSEMFFYYYPKGLLKKNPINVYEIPSIFNVEEKLYMKLVDELYEAIKELRNEFEDAGEKLWSNLTISIENLQFNIEYSYENIEKSTYSNYDRHIIWQYKYLQVPLERFSKRDRQMIEKYLVKENLENYEKKKYTQPMYKNNVHNIIEYDKEEKNEENQNFYFDKEEKLDKYEQYKRQKAKLQIQIEDNENIINNEINDNSENRNKNQILKY